MRIPTPSAPIVNAERPERPRPSVSVAVLADDLDRAAVEHRAETGRTRRQDRDGDPDEERLAGHRQPRPRGRRPQAGDGERAADVAGTVDERAPGRCRDHRHAGIQRGQQPDRRQVQTDRSEVDRDVREVRGDRPEQQEVDDGGPNDRRGDRG